MPESRHDGLLSGDEGENGLELWDPDLTVSSSHSRGEVYAAVGLKTVWKRSLDSSMAAE